MKNVFIINGHQAWEDSPGKLNSSLVKSAKEILELNNLNVKIVSVEHEWNNKEQVENFKWADVVIFQFPIFWFNIPWKMKKYLDEVLMEGYGTIFANDGRTPENPDYNYGKGGLLTNKKYMISMTWNAPLKAFTEKGEFFAQKSADDVLMCMHSTAQFCGMKALKSFVCYDVVKNSTKETCIKNWQEHLTKHIVQS